MNPRLTGDGFLFDGQLYACTIGRSGVTTAKREGDGATPAGRWRITGMLYRPDRLARPAGWAQEIAPGDLWSDDPADPDYNRMVKAPHGFSHEDLYRADSLYDLVILTDWNADRVPGQGSAIFIHEWAGPDSPTEGCIAFARPVLHMLAPALAPGVQVMVEA